MPGELDDLNLDSDDVKIGISRPGNRNGKHYAADTRAWLNRQVYNDYQERFQPHERELLDAVTGTEMLDERLSAIKINKENAFESVHQSANRRMGRYGVNSGGALGQSRDLQDNIAKTSAMTSAQNQTRQHVHDRNMAIVAGGTSRQAIEGI